MCNAHPCQRLKEKKRQGRAKKIQRRSGDNGNHRKNLTQLMSFIFPSRKMSLSPPAHDKETQRCDATDSGVELRAEQICPELMSGIDVNLCILDYSGTAVPFSGALWRQTLAYEDLTCWGGDQKGKTLFSARFEDRQALF